MGKTKEGKEFHNLAVQGKEDAYNSQSSSDKPPHTNREAAAKHMSGIQTFGVGRHADSSEKLPKNTYTSKRESSNIKAYGKER